MIAGFVVDGDEVNAYLFSASGPYLATPEGGSHFSTEEVLEDPRLMVVRHLENGETEEVGSNDDWVPNGGIRGYWLPNFYSDSKDSALVLSLEPGIYTVIVDGKGGSGMASVKLSEAIWLE